MKNELPKTKIDERTGIEYRLEGDYYIPNLTLPKQEKITLNKYGRMRLNYLKENRKAEERIFEKIKMQKDRFWCLSFNLHLI